MFLVHLSHKRHRAPSLILSSFSPCRPSLPPSSFIPGSATVYQTPSSVVAATHPDTSSVSRVVFQRSRFISCHREYPAPGASALAKGILGFSVRLLTFHTSPASYVCLSEHSYCMALTERHSLKVMNQLNILFHVSCRVASVPIVCSELRQPVPLFNRNTSKQDRDCRDNK